MQYEVKIGEQRYKVEAPTKYDAKVQAVREFAKKNSADYANANEVLRRLRVEVVEPSR